jgi:predicted ATP-dependent endonuclease of OLD family
MFQNIIDSGDVSFEDDVTCLVGKNESGKTAFLQALRRLNPAQKTGAAFDPSQHYPRWFWKGDEKKGKVADTQPIRSTFKLEPDDTAAVDEQFGPEVLTGDTITVARTYGGK